jgi:regulator of replication initiation timing
MMHTDTEFNSYVKQLEDAEAELTKLREQNLQLQAENEKMREFMEDVDCALNGQNSIWSLRYLNFLSTQPTTIAEHDEGYNPFINEGK